MTTRTQRLLVALAVAVAARRASAHEVDCSKLAGIVRRAPGGGPLLDPDGLPSLVAPPSVALTVNHYPAIVAFDVRIRNLATEPSVLTTVADVLPLDLSRVQSFGDVLAGTIPLGGALHRVNTVEVKDLADCLATFPLDRVDEPACGLSRENALTVTTESDIASCRARVVCAPAAAPPPAVCTGPSWSGSLSFALGQVSVAYDATVACDGTTWIAGLSADPRGPLESVLRVDPAGQFSWIRLDDAATTVRLDGSGSLDVAGRRVTGTASGGAALRQLEQTGTVRWEYDPTDFVASQSDPRPGIGADVDAASNVVFAYRTVVAGRGSEIALVKLTHDGSVLWTRQLGTPGDDDLGRVVVAPDGGIYVGGTTTGAFPGQTSAGGADAFLAHLDPDGNVLWVRQLGSVGADAGGVALARDGSRVVLYGTAQGAVDGGAPPVGTSDAFVAVFDPSGKLQWLRELRDAPPRSTPPVQPFTTGVAAAVDGTGAVWLGGATAGDTTDPSGVDGYVARYDAAGSLLWSRRLGAGRGTTSEVSAIAIDPSGAGILTQNARGGISGFVLVDRVSPGGT